MKKIFTTFLLGFFILDVTLPAYAVTEPISTQDNSSMPVEHHSGVSLGAVNDGNALMDLITTPVTPANAYEFNFSLDLNGPVLKVGIQGGELKLTNARGVQGVGAFDPSTLSGNVTAGEGYERKNYNFQFKPKSGGTTPFILDKVVIGSPVIGHTYEYDENGKLAEYHFAVNLGPIKLEINAEPGTNADWKLTFSLTGDPKEQYYGYATISNAQIDDFIHQSWTQQALFIYQKAYMIQETDKSDPSTDIVSVRNADDKMEQKLAVTTAANGVKTYYVVHPTEPKRRLFIQNQTPVVQAVSGGTPETFSAYFNNFYENGMLKRVGLVIKQTDGTRWYVDYPAVNAITINSRTYDITLGANGILQMIERVSIKSGAVSAYATTGSANLVQWDLMYYPSQGTKLPVLDNGDDFARVEIYRKAPGAAKEELYATLNYLTNQYLDTNIQDDFDVRLAYAYTIKITNRAGVTRFVPSNLEKINYGQGKNMAEGDLKPENVLIIASSRNTANGKQKSMLADGTDLVEYYAGQRGIPSDNIVRLDIEDGYQFVDQYQGGVLIKSAYQDFYEKVLLPIKDFMAAKNITGKIMAFTTMPGAHMNYKALKFEGFTAVRTEIPVETIISDSIPKMLRGEKPTVSFKTKDYYGGKPFEDVQAYRYASSSDEYDLDTLLQNHLGYTRMAAPEITAEFTASNLLANGHSWFDLVSLLNEPVTFGGTTLDSLAVAVPELAAMLSSRYEAQDGMGWRKAVAEFKPWDESDFWSSFGKMFDPTAQGADAMTLAFKEPILQFISDTYGPAAANDIRVNRKYQDRQNEIVAALNHLTGDLEFYKHSRSASPARVKTIDPASFAGELFAQLQAKGLLSSDGTLLKQEALLTTAEKEMIRWFNVQILNTLPVLGLNKNLLNDIVYGLDRMITGPIGFDQGDNLRPVFIEKYKTPFMNLTANSTDPKVLATRALLSRSNRTSLDTQLAVRNMLELFFPDHLTKNTGVKTAAENVKRMIDQSIAAEKKAEYLANLGITADHYAFIFDGRGYKVSQMDLMGNTVNYGDYRSMSAEKMLRDFGYTTYLDKREATLGTANAFSDAALLADLNSKNKGLYDENMNALYDKELYGYSGWYYPGNGNNVDDPTERHNYLYDYVEHLSPDGFASGSFITPLDSGRESGWFALKRDGVVMAVNAHEEPFVNGLADVVGAYVYTGTSLAFASVKAQNYTHWMANIFGDPLFNMGKNVLGTPKKSIENGIEVYTEIIQPGKLEADTITPGDFINGPRVGMIEQTYTLVPSETDPSKMKKKILRMRLTNGSTEIYDSNGGKTVTSTTGQETLVFDSLGRIHTQIKFVENPITRQLEQKIKYFTYP